MKVVIAPDSFKGSLSAGEVADNIAKGVRKVFRAADIQCVPMADGGEGTVRSLVDSTRGEIVNVRVKGPILKEVDAFYGILGDGTTAVIEMAAASGLPLLGGDERNPMKTTTYGTGELIKHALDKGCRNIIIGLGGSATNDGGAGMIKALGARLLDKEGNDTGYGGGSLADIAAIDLGGMDERLKGCRIVAACDVDNPLTGIRGASYVFGPQKGADEAMVQILDKNLEHYAEVALKVTGISIKDHPGAGAAGGLGGGLLAFLDAELKRGIDIVIEAAGLEEKIKDADFVITGEGMMDYQTQYGKTPYGVAQVARKYGIPVIAIVGSIGRNAEVLYDLGFCGIFSIIDRPLNLAEAMSGCAGLLERTSESIMRMVKAINNPFRDIM
ncbi:MAG TPA: glycerate kinase [Clostridia bacterium]|nr:glycerate kinase [Clostridia bacterium]